MALAGQRVGGSGAHRGRVTKHTFRTGESWKLDASIRLAYNQQASASRLGAKPLEADEDWQLTMSCS